MILYIIKYNTYNLIQNMDNKKNFKQKINEIEVKVAHMKNKKNENVEKKKNKKF